MEEFENALGNAAEARVRRANFNFQIFCPDWNDLKLNGKEITYKVAVGANDVEC